MNKLITIKNAINDARLHNKRIIEIRVSHDTRNAILDCHPFKYVRADQLNSLYGIPVQVVTNTDTFDLVIE